MEGLLIGKTIVDIDECTHGLRLYLSDGSRVYLGATIDHMIEVEAD